MLNTLILIGRLTKNPELRQTSSGLSIANVNLAVQRKTKNDQGQYEADFFRVNIWRTSGENFVSYCQKGDLVQVTAHLRNNSYQDKAGVTHYQNEIVVSEWSKLSRPKPAPQEAPAQISEVFGNPEPIPPFDDVPPLFTPKTRDSYGYGYDND
jgi:single-strand DNA-binding protein